MILQPVLENEFILIRPLQEADKESLYHVARDPLIWEQHPDHRYKREVFDEYFAKSIDSNGAMLILDKMNGAVIGSSRYNPVENVKSAIEIGWTFLARKYWGGRYNGMTKSLMINHALQYYKDIIFHIHHLNIRSQRSVEKLGARRTHDPALLKANPDEEWTFVINRQQWAGGSEST